MAALKQLGAGAAVVVPQILQAAVSLAEIAEDNHASAPTLPQAVARPA